MVKFKVNESLWQELMYYTNNLFYVKEYKHGRDIYPDRVVLSRNRDFDKILDNFDNKNEEYVTLNARSQERSPIAIKAKRKIAEKVITDSIFANNMFNAGKSDSEKQNYIALFEYVKKVLTKNERVTNYEKLNEFILNAYKKLSLQDALKVASFRESVIDKCFTNGLISAEFAEQQKELFPNSSIKLEALFKVKEKERANNAWFFYFSMLILIVL